METFLKNQIFNPAVIKFSTPCSGVGNRTQRKKDTNKQISFSCSLPQWHFHAKWALPSQGWQLPSLGIIHVFSKTHRWEKMTSDSCWLWQGFFGVIHTALTWALQPRAACVAPAPLSPSGPGVGVGWAGYWCLVLINHPQGTGMLLGSWGRKSSTCSEERKLNISFSFLKAAVPKDFFSSGRLFPPAAEPPALPGHSVLLSMGTRPALNEELCQVPFPLLFIPDSHTLLKPAGQSSLVHTRVFQIHLKSPKSGQTDNVTPWCDAGLEGEHLPSADAPGITKRN